MSEAPRSTQALTPDESPVPAPAASAGRILREAREAQGLHIAALAAAIKVTPRKVEALEGDRLNELPDATFARALAQTICRHLKIDAGPVLALLPAHSTISLEPASRIASTPYRERSGRGEQGASPSNIGPLLWGAAVFLAAAAVLAMAPPGWWNDGGTAALKEAERPAAAVAAPPAASTAASAVASAPLAVSAAASEAAAVSAAAAPAGVSSPLATAPAASPLVAGLPVVGAPAPAQAAEASRDRQSSAETVFSTPTAPAVGATTAVAGALVVTTTDASWIEVRDARGRTLLSEIVQPGRTVGLDGPLPLRLLVGNAAATQLVFMGKPVDLPSRTRDNVARFELQ